MSLVLTRACLSFASPPDVTCPASTLADKPFVVVVDATDGTVLTADAHDAAVSFAVSSGFAPAQCEAAKCFRVDVATTMTLRCRASGYQNRKVTEPVMAHLTNTTPYKCLLGRAKSHRALYGYDQVPVSGGDGGVTPTAELKMRTIREVPASARNEYLMALVESAKGDDPEADLELLRRLGKRAGVRDSYLAAFVANANDPALKTPSFKAWLDGSAKAIKAEEVQKTVLGLAMAKQDPSYGEFIAALEDPSGAIVLRAADLKVVKADLSPDKRVAFEKLVKALAAQAKVP